MPSAEENYVSEEEVLDHYQKKARPITQSFIDGIPWEKSTDVPLPNEVVEILTYMAAIEESTSGNAGAWLRGTPSGRDRIISPFVVRWIEEEMTHGYLLRRFLREIGQSIEEEPWQDPTAIFGIRINTRTLIANLFPEIFMMTHMVIGDIQERAALLAYQLLAERAKNPVLLSILSRIMQEEAIHMHFYEEIARRRLQAASGLKRRLTRLAVEKAIHPIGAGAGKEVKTQLETAKMLRMLLGDSAGVVKTRVDDKVARLLPGFAGFTRHSEKYQAYLDMAP